MRLQLRKAQAEIGDIVLLFGDESEALTHPYLARVWAKRDADLRVPVPGQAKKVAMMGSLDHTKRRLIIHTSRTKRSADLRLRGDKLSLRIWSNSTASRAPNPAAWRNLSYWSWTMGRSMSAR